MAGVLRFLFLLGLWLISRFCFRFRVEWISQPDGDPWSNIRLIAFLHHTSLFEFLFLGAVPLKEVWRMSRHVVVPVADKTLARPLVGFFMQRLAPKVISITRKKDASWDNFLGNLESKDIIVIFPEGRMMRKNGLDKDGHPMSIRGGIADILTRVDDGKMLIAYSGGLHHVQTPGTAWVHLFKTLTIRFEVIAIEDYKKLHAGRSSSAFKVNVIRDLEKKMYTHCPMPTPN